MITKQELEQALEPLTKQIEALTKMVALMALATGQKAPKAQKVESAGAVVPANVAEMKVALDGIPAETIQALGVVGVAADPNMPWVSMKRVNGTSISIKKVDNGFRIRVRDGNGELLKELTPTMNGLNGALAKLAE